MPKNPCSLVVEPSHPDLVINVGNMFLGEENRNYRKLPTTQRKEERMRIVQAACALLNSGGGVIKIEMANQEDHSVEMGLDLEKSLRDLIGSSDLQAYFETKQEGKWFYIFVKSWSSGPVPKYGLPKPRICSLSSSLNRRSGTSVCCMSSSEAFDFLKTRKKVVKYTLSNEGSTPNKIPRAAPYNISESNPAFEVFQSDRIEYGHILPFPESQSVEFKQFSTDHIQIYLKRIIPEYISAFANAGGGYLFIGVDDKTKQVKGCTKENVDRNSLETAVAEAISKVSTVHFCSSDAQVSVETKVIDVFKMDIFYGYLLAIKVEPFCCAVFSEAPISWMVSEEEGIYCLTTSAWVAIMLDTDPVSPKCLRYIPRSVWLELFLQHEGLEEFVTQHMSPDSYGILIFSRSWAVDLNLQAKRGVICDVLLVAQNKPPTLYTILGEQDADGQDYCTRTAFTLKQKLVNVGGYSRKVCVMTRVLCLSSDSSAVSVEDSGCPIVYPRSYNLADTHQMEALLQALAIVLLGFNSFLSDQLGCKFLNLLTIQQYKILSENLYDHRDLFVHGLPGSGKTVIAKEIIKKIRNVFHCEPQSILYICENQLLRDFIRSKNICQAVTRKTFMKHDFKEIQHIVIDEAQNFCCEDGDWFEKAYIITKTGKDCPGIFWIFLDYYQTSHLNSSGLPSPSYQYPRKELSRIVRNADDIANYLQRVIRNVRDNPPPNIPPGSLIMLQQPEQAPGVPGSLETIDFTNLEEMVIFVAEKCQMFFKSGYSSKDIAVLFSTAGEADAYRGMFLKEMRKRKVSQVNDASIFAGHLVVDSVRRFSGLESNIVFGVNPWTANPAIFHNFLLCLASRARKHLYILRHTSVEEEI
ncbi:schlafen family member 13-like [Ctenodactylus gundi]